MPPAPVVGVTQRVVAGEHGEVRLALDVRWPAFLAACGLVGVPLPLDPELAEQTMDRVGCAGVVLTGGDDLHAYGGPGPARDLLERHLLKRVVARDQPLIGVCRGMLMMAHTYGAELRRVEGHVATWHRLDGDGGRLVNSYHHWAVLDPPPAFAVLARRGRVAESVRHVSAPLTGLMWHPERCDPFDPADVELFARTFGAAP